MQVRVLGISGSLRRDSFNTRLLAAAADGLPDDVELVRWDGLADVPPFDEDAEAGPAPAAVADLRAAIADADAVLFATPEYNGSVPGQLKNALDWVSRPYATNPLRNTPAAVVGASTGGFGAVGPRPICGASSQGSEHASSTPNWPCRTRARAATRTGASTTTTCGRGSQASWKSSSPWHARELVSA